MEKLKHTRLWVVLHDLVDFKDDLDLTTMLDNFVQELYHFCRDETIIAERTRSLNYVRNDLDAHLEQLLNGAKKKCAVTKDHQAVDVLC